MSDTDSEAIPHGVADDRDDAADEPAPEPPPEPSPEVERLRLEVRHRDQLLAAAEQRRIGLEREIERLERQLLAAIEAQREDSHERAELRRLLGNAQLQAHSLMRIAPPADPAEAEEAEPPPPPEPETPVMRASGGGQPGAIIYAGPAAPVSSPPLAAPAAVDAPPEARPAPRRGLADDARDVLSSVGRLFRPRR